MDKICRNNPWCSSFFVLYSMASLYDIFKRTIYLELSIKIDPIFSSFYKLSDTYRGRPSFPHSLSHCPKDPQVPDTILIIH